MPLRSSRGGHDRRARHLQLVRPIRGGHVGEAATRIAAAAARLAAIGRQIAAEAGELRAATAGFQWEGRG